MTGALSPPASDSELPPSYDAAASQPLITPATAVEPNAEPSAVPPVSDKKSRSASSDDPLNKPSRTDDHSMPPVFSVHNPDVYTGGRRTKLSRATSHGQSQKDVAFQPTNVLTHDAHLNQDGEALYRFLLRTALTPPKVTVQIKGWHEEYREVSFQTHHHRDRRNNRHHSRHSQNDHQTTNKVPVVDFDFAIDLTPLLQLSVHEGHRELPDPRVSPIRHPVLDNPTLFVKQDYDLAYRGRMVQEILVPSDSNYPARRRRQSHLIAQIPPDETFDDHGQPLLQDPADLEAATRTLDYVRPGRQDRKGLREITSREWLPWTVGVVEGQFDNRYLNRAQYDEGVATERVSLRVDDSTEQTSALDTMQPSAEVKVRAADGASLMTVRTACDIYTRDTKQLKQFRVKKVVAGWNMTDFEDAIRNIVEEVYPTAYANDRQIKVEVKVEDDLITVMPDSDLARFVTTLQRTTHLTRFLIWMALVLTGTFLIVLPVVGILLYFKGSRYNTVGIVWQLSQWEIAGNLAVDDEPSVNVRLLKKERESAALAGASWALDNATDPYHSEEAPGTVAGSSSSPSKPLKPSEYGPFITSEGVVQQQPFLLASTSCQVLAHRGVRQGDVVRAWEGRILVAKAAVWLANQPYGIPLALGVIVLTSIPPIPGYGFAQTLCGLSFGSRAAGEHYSVWKGWLVAAGGCLLGSAVAFGLVRLVMRYISTHRRVKDLKDHRNWRAMEAAIQQKGIPIVILLRLAPFPFCWSNLWFASMASVSLPAFLVATLCITPKLLLHVFVGSKLYLLLDKEGQSLPLHVRVMNWIYIAVGILIGWITTRYLWKTTQQILADFEAREELEEGRRSTNGEAHAAHADAHEASAEDHVSPPDSDVPEAEHESDQPESERRPLLASGPET
ncbi:Tlg2-vesicle protein [Tilletia horrida]|nr:Tlg2-vesicle protein [Tilletia horrida]